MNGFSLVELMLSLSLGLGLSGVMLQGLMAEGQNGARFSRLLRERAAQRRTLELVKNDVARATAVGEEPQLELHACGLAGRTPVLHLSTPAGPITYSVGRAPSTIWRGWVLMRCGPAFGLTGEPSLGSQAQNRVVIDGLAEQPQRWIGCASLLGEKGEAAVDLGGSANQPFSVCLHSSSGLVGVRLIQAFGETGQPQMLQSSVLLRAST
jgi:hypothetical protein